MKLFSSPLTSIHYWIVLSFITFLGKSSLELHASSKEEELTAGHHLSVRVNKKNGFFEAISIRGVPITGFIYIESNRGDETQMNVDDFLYRQSTLAENTEIAASDHDSLEIKGDLVPLSKIDEPLKFQTSIQSDAEKERLQFRSTLTPTKESSWTYPGGYFINLLLSSNKDRSLRIIDLKGKDRTISLETNWEKSILAQTIIYPMEEGDLIFEADDNSKIALQDYRVESSKAGGKILVLRINANTPWKRTQNILMTEKTEFGFSVTYKPH
ncbi:MAG: hypothetical protein V4507_08715 [Verrucomicrobiota bacterium]